MVRIVDKRAFKTDESFLEKIAIGAVGTKKVFEDLKKQGHSPIELERGSMSFKIWKKIKIKRIRVPDLLCLKCGKRIESRAKTKLEITMSHSFASPERGWDFGLNDDDLIALAKCTKIGERPIDWEAMDIVQYLSIKAMRKAFRENKRIITLKLMRNGINLDALVQVGDKIEEGQIVASTIPVSVGFACRTVGSESYYLKLLDSPSLTDRYTAAKALRHFDGEGLKNVLLKRVNDKKEHIYIRLEAASSLLKMGEKGALDFFRDVLKDSYLENRLECVIILGEIQKQEACKLLIETLLDEEQNPEIRAGAAWSLGELRFKESLSALVKVFNDVEMGIRAEAARALVKINEKFVKDTIKCIPKSREDERAGLAWSLSKSGNFTVKELLKVMVDDEARKWISWIIGTQNEKKFIDQIEELKDKEVYFAVTVLWKILSSWIEGLEIY
jgi:hypothetical protein